MKSFLFCLVIWDIWYTNWVCLASSHWLWLGLNDHSWHRWSHPASYDSDMKSFLFCLVIPDIWWTNWMSLACSHWLWLVLDDHSCPEYTCLEWYQTHTFTESTLENINFGSAFIKGRKGKLNFQKKLLVEFLSVWLRQVLGHPVIIWHWNQLTHSHRKLSWETRSISDPLLPRHHIYKYIILII